MKIKNITIGIKSLESGLKEFNQTVRGIQMGRLSKPKKEASYFVDVAAFQSVVTAKRIELLHAIHERKPQSIYELAQLVNRNLKNVQTDVALLARMGLVSLRKKKELRNKVVPKVEYDRLQIQIAV